MTLSGKAPTACSRPGFEPQHAFVVQFATGAGMLGRVEHVVSGRMARFATEASLLDFMRSVLEEVNPAYSGTPNAQIHGGQE